LEQQFLEGGGFRRIEVAYHQETLTDQGYRFALEGLLQGFVTD
jgi:hypothetical protein